jgi:hypothetical protein
MRKRVGLCCAGLLLAFAAGGCKTSTVNTNGSENDGVPCAVTNVQQPEVNAAGALIVTDISGSMKGFALAGSTRLYTLHSELERAVREASDAAATGTQVQRCYLGEQFDCAAKTHQPDPDKPDTYGANQSRLDLFFAQAGGAQPAAGQQGDEDAINLHRLAVLVTDGMQARKPDAGAQPGACMGGADPDCIAYLLKQRVDQGYGVWMTLLLLPFKGTHYAERPLDNEQWQRIQQHIAQLQSDPYFQGVNFSVQRNGSAVPFESFNFQGVKPILVIALSRDWTLGRKFVAQFTAAIKRESVVQPASGVYSLELAPLAVKPRLVSAITLAPEDPAIGVRPIVTGTRTGDHLEYLTECERKGDAKFIFSTEEGAGPQSVPNDLPLNFRLVPAEQDEGLLTITPAAGQTYEGRLVCQQYTPGTYDVWLKLQAELSKDPPANAFWSALHADNIYEAPERLYGLRDLVQKVLAGVTEKPRVTDCVRFQIERKAD